MKYGEIKEVSFIGFGKVGSTLAAHFLNCGLQIRQVLLKSKRAIDIPNVTVIDSFKDLQAVDLVFICVNDDAITEVVSNLSSNQAFASTSGAVGLENLGKRENHCVFYPFQSFVNLQKDEIPKIPILIESANPPLLQVVKELALKCFHSVQEMSSEKRFQLHLAAVFANNFTNHLVHVAQSICKENDLNFELLRPLIRHTAENWQQMDAATSQTGPAVRNDQEIIKKHLLHLREENQYIYCVLTESIQKEKGILWKITNSD